jgi:hypothetical protein
MTTVDVPNYAAQRAAIRRVVRLFIALAEQEEKERADSGLDQANESAAEDKTPIGENGVLL